MDSVEFVAQTSGFALFRLGSRGVVVDTEDLNVFDPQSFSSLVAGGYGWNSHDQEPKKVWKDLAEAAFKLVPQEDVEVETAPSARTYRVPESVKNNARQALETSDKDKTTPTLVASAEKISSGTVSCELVKRMHTYFSKANSDNSDYQLWGGESGASWASKTFASLVAAGEITAEDGTELKPHEFVPSSVDPSTCEICGLFEDDVVHEAFAAVDDADDNSTLERYAVIDSSSTDEVFAVSSVIYQDQHGDWWDSNFEPVSAPEETAELAQLTDERAVEVEEQLKSQDVAELAITEDLLTEFALPELDLPHLDAVFAQVPFVDPAVRSENAKKQSRDGGGRFAVGGRVATPTIPGNNSGKVTSVGTDTVDVDMRDGTKKKLPQKDVQPAVVKAKLPAALPLIDDIAGRLQQYILGFESSAVTAAGEAAVAEAQPATSTATVSGQTEYTPLYLAVVDDEDPQAVLDVIAVVASKTQQTNLTVFKRQDGDWVDAPDLLEDLQSATPPPLVELDQNTLVAVLDQMDPKTASATFATVYQFTLTASGELTRSQVRGAVPIFPSYAEMGYFPSDLVQRLDELAEGGADKNRGNAERLRRYWTKGEGGIKIGWNTDGDWTRCRQLLSKHLGERAAGYCTLRHKEMTGRYPGDKGRPGPGV